MKNAKWYNKCIKVENLNNHNVLNKKDIDVKFRIKIILKTENKIKQRHS